MLSIDISRPVYIWGTGSAGENTYLLIKNRFVVQGFIDSDSQKWGKDFLNLKILKPDVLIEQKPDKPFVIIASIFYAQIEKELIKRGYGYFSDYVYYFDLEQSDHQNNFNTFSKFYHECGPEDSLSKLRSFSDDFWFWLNTIGYRVHPLVRELLSPLPADEIQIRLTGVAGDVSLLHAFNQYKIMKALLQKHDVYLDKLGKLLDFGCGYARLLRFFVKDTDPGKLYGTDINSEFVNWCRENTKFGHYYANDAFPPTVFEDKSFSFIFAFSVFTHLSENSHLIWMKEMNRLLEDGGFILFTIWNHPTKTIDYHRRYFADYNQLIRDYESGKFCYDNTAYGGSTTYAEALVPLSYIKEKWSRYFTFLDCVENHPHSPSQNHVLLRKK
jgi:SAM-dependent methyltransferase